MKVLSTYLHTLRRFKHFNTSEAAGIHGTLRRLQSETDCRKEKSCSFCMAAVRFDSQPKSWLYFCILKDGVWASFRSLYAPEKGKASFEITRTVMG